MQSEASFLCAWCGETNFTFADVSQGSDQQYVEDCQICCRPNVLNVRFSEDLETVMIDTEME
jgi:hypothetical protein